MKAKVLKVGRFRNDILVRRFKKAGVSDLRIKSGPVGYTSMCNHLLSFCIDLIGISPVPAA